jgi:ketosteroid isomerase-like protein
MKLSAVAILALMITGCGYGSEETVLKEKESLLETDRAFAAASAAMGPAEAFNQYLHDEALMLPAGGNPVKGRASIYDVMKDAPYGYVLAWTPEDGEAARSGDLGYTWGKYISSVPDSEGVAQKRYGKYVNVWKKDPSGKWKVLVDTGNQSPPPDEK